MDSRETDDSQGEAVQDKRGGKDPILIPQTPIVITGGLTDGLIRIEPIRALTRVGAKAYRLTGHKVNNITITGDAEFDKTFANNEATISMFNSAKYLLVQITANPSANTLTIQTKADLSDGTATLIYDLSGYDVSRIVIDGDQEFDEEFARHQFSFKIKDL